MSSDKEKEGRNGTVFDTPDKSCFQHHRNKYLWKVLTSKIISRDKLAGWSMSRLSADAAPDITKQANRFTTSGYFRPWVLYNDRSEGKIYKWTILQVRYNKR